MTSLPRDYDAWRLSGPDDDLRAGEYEGEDCNRFPEIDEDAPRNYRPRRCNGVMIMDEHVGYIFCDTCGELAE